MFVSMITSCLKCTCIYAADVKSIHFQEVNTGEIRIQSSLFGENIPCQSKTLCYGLRRKKTCLRGLRTSKAQTSLRIRAVSGLIGKYDI